MSAWVLLLVFAFAEGGATSVTIDMANYQACARAQEQARSASEPFRRDESKTLRVAVCLERAP